MFKPIPDYPGYYVSDRGVVASRNKFLKPHVTSNGYHSVALYKDGVPTHISIHVLMGKVFIGPRPVAAVICHEDDDRTNNNLPNLTLSTMAINHRDRIFSISSAFSLGVIIQ